MISNYKHQEYWNYSFKFSLKLIILSVLSAMTMSSCFLFYTFKDISINPDVKTYYVENFQNNAFNSPANLNQSFSEELRSKVRKETSLSYNDNDPDITFSGSIQSFTVSSQAPKQDGSAVNRLEITIKVIYTNSKYEKENWEKSFSYHSDFPQSSNLAQEQDKLIKEIFNFILDEVINNAFNNW
jgi:hypothetical protein